MASAVEFRRSLVAPDNYLLHKLHSLTGIIPVGFFVVQHLVLNSFSLTGAKNFNAVIEFFEIIPRHIFMLMEVGIIFLPLLFHAAYGLLITSHGTMNYQNYTYKRNLAYIFQRVSGIFLVLYITYHVFTTTLMAKYFGAGLDSIKYAGMHEKFQNPLIAAIYILGITAATYHLSNGVWAFCIRWGITLTEESQNKCAAVCTGLFVLLTGFGWLAFYGFINPIWNMSH
ncbi:MAG: succinate dehydrogenase/fumarate reductase transmembrane subunit [Armatimonadota bacterium]